MVMLRGRVNGELTLKSIIAWVNSHPIAFSIIFAAPNSYIFGFFHLSLVSGVEVIDQIAISEAFFTLLFIF
jgi:membrane-bound lytic murein transglycosylase